MAMSDKFYNQSRKRHILTKNDECIRKKAAPISLTKLSCTTKTFWQQSDALNYIVEREQRNCSNEILYLFSFESQPEGKRRYQVADIDVFIQEYYQLPANQRHTYEIIVDKKPSKLYFDLEFDFLSNPTLNGPKLTTNFIQFVLNFMRKRSDDLDYSFKDVLVLDSTSDKKFSRHLIFQTKDPFLDNLAVGKFVNLILEDIHGCLINHQCSAIGSQSTESTSQFSQNSSVFARNLLTSLESRLKLFEECQCTDDYTGLKYRDMTEFIVNKVEKSGEKTTWFCDTGVYTKNRAFRLYRSSKFEKPGFIFTVAPENQWKPIVHCRTNPDEAERQTFMASLVYFDKPIRRFIHVDEENFTPVQTPITRTQRSTLSTYTTEDIRNMSLDYPELVNYMSQLAKDKDDLRISRLYKAKEIQNDFRWEISFLYVGDYKFCERIQRHHSNNNIYYVVDMRKGTYRQKCHDYDCRNFQGIERILPKNVTPWLTIFEDEWKSE